MSCSDSGVPRHVDILPVGAFGKAVARYLAHLHEGVREIPWSASTLEELPALSSVSTVEELPASSSVSTVKGLSTSSSDPAVEELSTSSIMIVAAWRPVTQLCQRVAHQSHQRARPFIPLILESSLLRIGPVVIPGASACWPCWEARSQQHATLPRERAALLRFYDAHPLAGPSGYLEPFALLGAAQLAALTSPDIRSDKAGFIWQMDLLTREVSTSRLVGVDACPRCGLKRPVESRSYLRARAALAGLWDERT